jgi:hypothetical protein
MNVKSCPTYDNIFIEIEVGAVFKCKEDEKSIAEALGIKPTYESNGV